MTAKSCSKGQRIKKAVMNTITVWGMVISSMPMGEYDRRLEILTDTLGRISAFARGARKPSSPLVSASRVFAFGEFDLYEGRSAYSVNGARIFHYFEELAFDMEQNLYGFYFLEFVSFFTREGLDAKMTLKLLYQSLRALSVPTLKHSLVKAVFELKCWKSTAFVLRHRISAKGIIWIRRQLCG